MVWDFFTHCFVVVQKFRNFLCTCNWYTIFVISCNDGRLRFVDFMQKCLYYACIRI